MYRLLLIAAAILVLTVVLAFSGCARQDGSEVLNFLPTVYSPLASAQAHVNSADALVVKAMPESSKTGQALLSSASKEHGSANADIDTVKTDLAKVASERDQLDKDNAGLVAENAKIKSGWGYRLQMFVLKLFWAIVGLVFLHFALGIAGFFIAGPVGSILAKVGAFLNPFTWFQTVRDNAWFNYKKPLTCPECPPLAIVPGAPMAA